ncbi:MAG: hypothetical protein ACC662_03525 [Planctomycetota bacterium]
MMDGSGECDGLLQAIVRQAEFCARREQDQSANEKRRLVQEAEEHVEALERAVKQIGEVRGRAASTAIEEQADEEIRTVWESAFDRLCERFLARVRLALESQPGTPRYPAAVAAWAASAATCLDSPGEVFCAARDREIVYDALLAAGARDFRVRADPKVHAGLVLRDLDGRILLDRRPAALVDEHAAALRDLLRAHVPPASLPSDAGRGDAETA